jgi:hypothetical protein
MGQIGCPEMSVTYYLSTLFNTPEEQGFYARNNSNNLSANSRGNRRGGGLETCNPKHRISIIF